MSRFILACDLDECLIRTIENGTEQTYLNANIVSRSDKMAVYFRPYLLEFLYQFVPDKNGKKQIDFEIMLFTMGTQDYANFIIKDILQKLKEKYTLSQQQVDSLFKIRVFRENIKNDYKDLNLIAKRAKVNIDNILLVDDRIQNFYQQPYQGIQIQKYSFIRPKDNELLKLMIYLKTFDTSGKLTLKQQNIFKYQEGVVDQQ